SWKRWIAPLKSEGCAEAHSRAPRSASSAFEGAGADAEATCSGAGPGFGTATGGAGFCAVGLAGGGSGSGGLEDDDTATIVPTTSTTTPPTKAGMAHPRRDGAGAGDGSMGTRGVRGVGAFSGAASDVKISFTRSLGRVLSTSGPQVRQKLRFSSLKAFLLSRSWERICSWQTLQ